MKDYVVFSISSNKTLAKDFAKFWNCQLGKLEVKRYPDGETLIYPITNVENKDVILIESTPRKPHEHLLDILLALDSFNNSNAKTITLIVPFLSYSRQERVNNPKEPVSAQVVAKLLETGKYDRLLTFDLHHPNVAKFYNRGIENIPTATIFGNYYSSLLKEKGISNKDVVIVSPDHGINERTDMLMFALRGSKRVILEKVKDEKSKTERFEIKADVQGKTCIIFDDIISTGATIAAASKLLYKKGASTVFAAATHGIFAKGSLELIKKARVKDIAVTNTIDQGKDEKVNCLDVLQIILETI